MATDLAKRQQDEQFSILDPPSLPQRPYWPNPLQFSLIGLLGGLVIGMGATILHDVSDPCVRTEEDMRQWINAKVIAAIPPLLTQADQKRRARRRSLEILAGSAMAAFIPLISVIAYLKR
jgi:hypothetical protein